MSWGIAGLLEYVLAPPGGLIILLLVGLLLLGSRKITGVFLISSATILLYLCSIPFTVNLILNFIEPPTTISEQEFVSPRAQAVVILGASRREHAPEFNLPHESGDTVSDRELERIRYGVWLAKRTNLPILVTGGLPDQLLREPGARDKDQRNYQ